MVTALRERGTNNRALRDSPVPINRHVFACSHVPRPHGFGSPGVEVRSPGEGHFCKDQPEASVSQSVAWLPSAQTSNI